MFTGLIEEQGTIVAITQNANGFQLVIQAKQATSDIALGHSIAVNGVCLTVTAFADNCFSVGLAPETRSRSNLDRLQVQDQVNLERAALPTTRLGGHYVQGHVDATGRILDVRKDQDCLRISIQAPLCLRRYIVSKGYITIDGASLTVVDANADRFEIMLVAYSQQILTLAHKQPGELVNLEVDILAKYVESLLAFSQTEHPTTQGGSPCPSHP